MNEFAIGTIMVHPKSPAWGPGKVVRADGRFAFVVWRDTFDQAKNMDTAYLAIAAGQSDEILDNLPPFVEKNGHLVLPAEQITETVAIFLDWGRYG